MALHPSNYYTNKHTHTYNTVGRSMTYSHTHHVACRCPNVSSNRSSDPSASGHLPSPSPGQQPSFVPPSPAYPPVSVPSNALRVLSLHHVHSHHPSTLSRLSSTFSTSMPYLPLAPCCTLPLPFVTTFHLLVPPNVLTTTTLGALPVSSRGSRPTR